MTTPYEDLGVPPDATKADIKKAYRKKAQKSHPDKGGSDAEFKQLATSYAVLSDDASRKRFDETGEVKPGPADNLLTELAQMLCGILDRVQDAGTTDVIGLMRKQLKSRAAQIEAQKADVARNLLRLNGAIRRIKVAQGKPNELSAILESIVGSVTQASAGLDVQAERVDQLHERLTDYSYTVDVASQANIWTPMTSTNTFFR